MKLFHKNCSCFQSATHRLTTQLDSQRLQILPEHPFSDHVSLFERRLGALLLLANLPIRLNHCLLCKHCNRTGAFRTYLLNSLFGSTALRDQVACQDGSGTATTCTAMDRDRQPLCQKAINDDQGSLDLIEGWASKSIHRQVLPAELVLAEQVERQWLFREIEQCKHSQFSQQGNGIFRAGIGNSFQPVLNHPTKGCRHNPLLFLLCERIRLQDTPG